MLKDPDFPESSEQAAQSAKAFSQALRKFLNVAAALREDEAVIAGLVSELGRLTDRLEPQTGPEEEAVWRKAPRNYPTALLPAYDFRIEADRLEGVVRFGRFHIGRLAAHGGAIGMVFDELFGALVASGGRSTARTAYLHIDFRALVPIDVNLQVSAWFTQETGRKHFVRGEIRNGDVVCAEAEGLWLSLKPGQV